VVRIKGYWVHDRRAEAAHADNRARNDNELPASLVPGGRAIPATKSALTSPNATSGEWRCGEGRSFRVKLRDTSASIGNERSSKPTRRSLRRRRPVSRGRARRPPRASESRHGSADRDPNLQGSWAGCHQPIVRSTRDMHLVPLAAWGVIVHRAQRRRRCCLFESCRRKFSGNPRERDNRVIEILDRNQELMALQSPAMRTGQPGETRPEAVEEPR
jgi:hypothetical protein